MFNQEDFPSEPKPQPEIQPQSIETNQAPIPEVIPSTGNIPEMPQPEQAQEEISRLHQEVENAFSAENKENQEKKEFNWSDFKYINENNLGLRHVSDQRTMERDMQEGFQGDSFAINNIRNIVPQEMLPEKAQEMTRRFGIKPDVPFLDKVLDEDKKAQVIQIFHEAVSSFIDGSISYNEMVSRGDSKEQYVNAMKGKHSFLILHNPTEGGYDEKSYYGLGKSGKREYSPADILSTISADEIVQALNVSEKGTTELADSDFDQHVCETIYGLLVGKIKSLQIKSES